MGALTPASGEDLPPLAADSPGFVAVVTDIDFEDSVTESAGRIWADLVRRYGPSLVLLEHDPAPELAEGGWRPSTWSGSAPMGAHIAPASGRPRRSIPVMPGWSFGWPHMGIRSSPGLLAGSTRAGTSEPTNSELRRLAGQNGQ